MRWITEMFSSLAGVWQAVALTAAAIACYIVLRVVWSVLIVRVSRRAAGTLGARLAEACTRPVRLLFWVTAVALAAPLAAGMFPERWDGYYGMLKGIIFILVTAAVLNMAIAALSAVQKWLAEHEGAGQEGHRTAAVITGRFLKFIFIFIAALVVLDHFNVEVTALMGAAGIASLALAFAAQETLANVIAGIAILGDRPFRVGDRLELADGRIGDVTDIGLRSTKILSFDATLLIIPNSEIIKSPVINHSYPDRRVKVRHNLGVAYGSDVKKVKSVLLEIVSTNPAVLKEPEPAVYFAAFGESSLDMLVVFWVDDYKDRIKTLDAVNMAVQERFAEQGIEIPFPQRDVWMRSKKESAA